VVVACNAEGTVFTDMTSAPIARDCVMWCVTVVVSLTL
jgi:hypothetical protein